jgi:hypothetical protein
MSVESPAAPIPQDRAPPARATGSIVDSRSDPGHRSRPSRTHTPHLVPQPCNANSTPMPPTHNSPGVLDWIRCSEMTGVGNLGWLRANGCARRWYFSPGRRSLAPDGDALPLAVEGEAPSSTLGSPTGTRQGSIPSPWSPRQGFVHSVRVGFASRLEARASGSDPSDPFASSVAFGPRRPVGGLRSTPWRRYSPEAVTLHDDSTRRRSVG